MPEDPAALDTVTDALAEFAPTLVTAAGVVIGIALTFFAVKWGGKKLMSVFKSYAS